MENTKKENVLKRFASAVGGNNLVLIGAIIVVFILFTAINPNYLTWTNFVNLLVAASLVGIVAVGHTYLIIAGQNDLSPGSLCAFCGVAVALMAFSYSFWYSSQCSRSFKSPAENFQFFASSSMRSRKRFFCSFFETFRKIFTTR